MIDSNMEILFEATAWIYAIKVLLHVLLDYHHSRVFVEATSWESRPQQLFQFYRRDEKGIYEILRRVINVCLVLVVLLLGTSLIYFFIVLYS